MLLKDPGRSNAWALLADLQQLFPGQEADLVWLHRADPLLALILGDLKELERLGDVPRHVRKTGRRRQTESARLIRRMRDAR